MNNPKAYTNNSSLTIGEKIEKILNSADYLYQALSTHCPHTSYITITLAPVSKQIKFKLQAISWHSHTYTDENNNNNNNT